MRCFGCRTSVNSEINNVFFFFLTLPMSSERNFENVHALTDTSPKYDRLADCRTGQQTSAQKIKYFQDYR